jgi:hypothetical protein
MPFDSACVKGGIPLMSATDAYVARPQDGAADAAGHFIDTDIARTGN